MSVPCKSFPYFVTATAQFATNGPTKVGWRWETNLGEAIARDPLLFLEGGSETEQILYRVNGVGNFWIQAHAFSPNDVSGIAYFKVTCVQ